MVTVLTNAMEGPDAQGYVAYQAARLGFGPEMVVETLARVGLAQDSYARAWADWLGDYRLGQWREWVAQLLALAGTAKMGLPERVGGEVLIEAAEYVLVEG